MNSRFIRRNIYYGQLRRGQEADRRPPCSRSPDDIEQGIARQLRQARLCGIVEPRENAEGLWT
jgi:hypothetical protein